MPNPILCSPRQFQNKLLTWFDQKGRKNLPWQQNKSPYRVWISEIMLQQTQVTTVIPYYTRFLERFPSLEVLATADENEVLHLWTGLGYYNRARNLHQTAKKIIQLNYFPNTLIELEKLPGIGRSTAGAILAIAFEKRAAILDGNVKRVLTRLAAIEQWPGEKEVLNQLWTLSEKLTPAKRIADYTQAIMDLGATVCTRTKPLCNQCPFKKNCRSFQTHVVNKLPISKPKKTLAIKQATFFIFKYKNNILLEKRSTKGVWKGLWSFPEISKKISPRQIQHFIQKRFSFEIENIQMLDSFKHTFSHFHLNIFPFIIRINKKSILNDRNQVWFDLFNPHPIGTPSPVQKIISKL